MDSTPAPTTPERIGVNVRNVIQLLGKHLYPTPEVVVRELLQNAYDSILSRFGEAATTSGRISIVADHSNSRLVIRDNGIGMDEGDLRRFLSQIGESLKKQEKARFDSFKTRHYVGDYGIGFFSAYLVAERIRVITRKLDGTTAFVWRSAGDEYYSIDALNDEHVGIGTSVELTLLPMLTALAKPETIRTHVLRYSNYLDCPIYLNDGIEPINKMAFPWEPNETKPTDDDLHFSILKDRRGLQYGIDLRLGGGTRSSHKIYSKRMFITSHLRFIPDHLDFCDVTVACDALTLNLSRDGVIEDQASSRLFTYVEEDVLEWLRTLLRRKNTRARLMRLLKDRQDTLRRLCRDDDVALDRLHPYLLFPTSSGDLLTVDDAAQRDQPGSRRVLVRPGKTSGDAPSDPKDRLLSVICEANDIPVFLIDKEDEHLFRKCCLKVGATRITPQDCQRELLQLDLPDQHDSIATVQRNLQLLLSRKTVVSEFTPPEIPLAILNDEVILNRRCATLVSLGRLKVGMDRLRPIYRSLIRISEAIDRSSADRDSISELLKASMETLETWSSEVQAAEVDRRRLGFLAEQWWGGLEGLQHIRGREKPIVRDGQEFRWRCFLVSPFSESYRDVQFVVKQVCGRYGILVETAADELNSQAILDKVCRYVDASEFAIVDITENNPNVLFELGLLVARRKPAIIMKNVSQGSIKGIMVPTDIIGIERIEYSNVTEDLASKLDKVCASITESRNAQGT